MMNRTRRLSIATLLTLSLAPMTAGSFSATLMAQNRGPVQRTLQGKVTANGGPAKGAVVYLKDEKGGTVKTYIAEDDGSYRFVQLAQGTDYDVWAKIGEKKGKTKTISSFDTKLDLILNLSVD